MSSSINTFKASHQSAWSATVTPPEFPQLDHDLHVDVCIVGAGIAGLTTAYLLLREGKSVAVLDRGKLAGGTTSMTTAHLASAIDDRFTEMERLHGQEGSRLAAESHAAAIDQIELIVSNEQIDCDFDRVDGYLMLGPSDKVQLLEHECAAAQRAGLHDVRQLDRAPLSTGTGPCLRFPRQAQFHPLKYLAAVAQAITDRGGKIFTQTHARKFQSGKQAQLEANGHTVTADYLLVATNTPINDLVAIHTKQAPYMTYALGAKIPRGSVPRGLYWDTEDPYHYVRTQQMTNDSSGDPRADDDLLIVGGEDHKTGQASDTTERHLRLEQWARPLFPMMGPIEYTWSGQVMETIDGLGFIGRNPMDKKNVFIATGDSGMGLTHGTIAGMLIRDLILGRDNPWEQLYDPARKTLKAALKFTKEQLNVAAQYGQWVTGGDVSDTGDIMPGEGAIVRHGLSKWAVYRDDSGDLHRCSAVCPHLGCLVNWNRQEHTWDCPCHGSRFAGDGSLLHGPANAGLESVEKPS